MVFDLIQYFLESSFLVVQFIHRLSKLGISDGGKTEGIGESGSGVRVGRRISIFISDHINIIGFRCKSGDRGTIYIISGSDLRSSGI